jgi:hypothetical protein
VCVCRVCVSVCVLSKFVSVCCVCVRVYVSVCVLCKCVSCTSV